MVKIYTPAEVKEKTRGRRMYRRPDILPPERNFCFFPTRSPLLQVYLWKSISPLPCASAAASRLLMAKDTN